MKYFKKHIGKKCRAMEWGFTAKIIDTLPLDPKTKYELKTRILIKQFQKRIGNLQAKEVE